VWNGLQPGQERAALIACGHCRTAQARLILKLIAAVFTTIFQFFSGKKPAQFSALYLKTRRIVQTLDKA
jgi:hypothetical protein